MNENQRTRRKLLWIVGVALALRLLVMAYTYPLELVPARDHWAFGYETGRIARSIAQGHGFGSPLFGNTGPTAWMTPVYPYIVAGFFKVFGIFTKASALAILSFNAITSALTCMPIFFIARKTFGASAGEWAGWIWAVFPYAVYWPVARIWDTWLAIFLLATLFWIVLHMAESSRVRDWIGFGVLSGIAALTEPIVLSVLPLLALWAMWRLIITRQNWSWVAPAIGAVLAVVLVVSPWFVRNERVFHKFIPFRDVFPLAVRVGNVGDIRNMLTPQAGPWYPTEWDEFRKYGETAYVAEKWHEDHAYVVSQRRRYVIDCLRRGIYVWTGFWYIPRLLRYGFEPEPSDVFVTSGLSILAFCGLFVGFRKKPAAAIPYAIILVFFPLAYYVTSLEPWYTTPMDPFLITLAAGAIVSFRPAAHHTRLYRGTDAVAHQTAHEEDIELTEWRAFRQ